MKKGCEASWSKLAADVISSKKVDLFEICLRSEAQVEKTLKNEPKALFQGKISWGTVAVNVISYLFF